MVDSRAVFRQQERAGGLDERDDSGRSEGEPSEKLARDVGYRRIVGQRARRAMVDFESQAASRRAAIASSSVEQTMRPKQSDGLCRAHAVVEHRHAGKRRQGSCAGCFSNRRAQEPRPTHSSTPPQIRARRGLFDHPALGLTPGVDVEPPICGVRIRLSCDRA